MCGRYAASRRPDLLIEEFRVDVDATGDKAPGPDFNVAPTKPVVVVLERTPKPDDAAVSEETAATADEPGVVEPVRQLRVVRWGLVPSWAKDPSIGSRMINARAETAASKPSYRRAFAHRRCLIPADGFFEWQAPDPDDPHVRRGKTGKPVKQPYYAYPRDGASLPMAGLYEFWRDPTRKDDDPDAWLVTCTVLTTDATDDFAAIHDRMPMVVAPDQWDAWLDPYLTDVDEVAGLLLPAGALDLEVYPVSTKVNDVRNNGPHLIDQVDPQAQDG